MGGGGGWRCCHRPQNKQICMPQNADFNKAVPKTADVIFAGAADLQKTHVEVRRLNLFCHRKSI